MVKRIDATRSRRTWLSWTALTLVLVSLGGIGSLLAVRVDHQANVQAVASAKELAETITRLTAHRALSRSNVFSRLSPAAVADLDGDVKQLREVHQLLGLKLWSASGHPLYSDGAAGPWGLHASQFAAALADKEMVSFFRTPGKLSQPAIEVLLPVDIDNDGAPEAVAEVVLPARWVLDSAGWATGQITAGIILLLLLSAVGLLVGQWRLRQRQHRANHDSLTGLGNRALLESTANRVLTGERDLAVLMMDLNGFRRVNDALGHAVGDELLVAVAGGLQKAIGPDDLLVRLGGDEFAVLVRHVDAEAALSAAKRLLSAVQTNFAVAGVDLDVDASVGVAICPRDGETIGRLLQSADIAMYQAKRGGLGVCSYAEAGGQVDVGKLALLTELRRGIDLHELVLHYQPAVAVQPGAGSFVEALVRWQHPRMGLLSPDGFIPLAEETALIHPLTEWVLNEAVRQCAQWSLDGLEVNVAVNVSPRSLTHVGLVEKVSSILARHKLPASALTIEITESAIIARADLAAEILGELTELGVTISIDDFGVGYTSLAHLKSLPVGILKIDKLFVSDLLSNDHDHAIVTSVILLGHNLGMEVVAEGVEDRQTLEHLGDLGCDLAQGFYMSRPLPAKELSLWLLSHPDLVPT
jgi:diguanylate cyclase (GGDEF)-like protein